MKNNDLELFCKYYVENLKYELLIPNVLPHVLLCKRFICPDVDCKKLCQTYVSSEAINRNFDYNFKNIYFTNVFSTDNLEMFLKDSVV